MAADEIAEKDTAPARNAGRKKPGSGRVFAWLCGGALAVNLLLVLVLLVILAAEGVPGFWPRAVAQITLEDGSVLLGEVIDREPIPKDEQAGASGASLGHRVKVKVGNKELQAPFLWVAESDVIDVRFPDDAVLLERTENGVFFGRLARLEGDGSEVIAEGGEATRQAFERLATEKDEEREAIEDLEGGKISDITLEIRDLEMELRGLALEKARGGDEEEISREREVSTARIDDLRTAFETQDERLARMRRALEAETLVLTTGSGEEFRQVAGNVEHAIFPNRLSFFDRLGIYFRRFWNFLSEKPREANTEGGILPAIFGTVMMVFIMSLVAVPLGVLAAVYLREYARQGPVVRVVRIAVNNLAGTPSIVFGIFGLGFFVYMVGGGIDRLFYPEALPENSTFGTGGILWASLTLALLTVPVVIVATEEGLAAVPNSLREASYALGSTKWETVRHIVIPAGPAIMTGTILSMARAAGEVAPLMILGMVKSASELPVDGRVPFIHLERKFMHLGYHVYDLGFQTPDIEATRPLVFTTALLLILIVTVMNLVAIVIRNRLRRRYEKSAV